MLRINAMHWEKVDLSVFPASEAYIGMARALSSRGHDFSVGGGAGASLAKLDPTAQDTCRFGGQVLPAAAFLIGIGPMRRASPLRQERTHVEHAVGTRPSRKAPDRRGMAMVVREVNGALAGPPISPWVQATIIASGCLLPLGLAREPHSQMPAVGLGAR